MKDPKPNLKPGQKEPWKDGLRYRRHLNGKLVVDAKIWSAVRNNSIETAHDNITDARAWLASQRVERSHGQPGVNQGRSKLSFAAIAAEWLESNPAKSKRACETNRDHLKGAGVVLLIEGVGMDRKVTVVGVPRGFGAQPIGRLKTSDVERLINTWKAEGYRNNTIAGMYSSVRAVFSYAEVSEAIAKRTSPCWDVREVPKWEKVERPVHRPDDAEAEEYIGVRDVSNDELIALADALGPDYQLAVWIALCFGLRASEMFGLTVGSVADLMRHSKVDITQVLDRQGNLVGKTKTAAGDRFIIDHDLAEDIKAHMAHRGISLSDPPDTLLFVNARTGGPLIYNAWTKLWRKALVKAGLDWVKDNGQHLGLHDLRSMNRTIMSETGVDQTTARKRFGHAGSSQDRLDDLYARSTPRQNRVASEKIHSVVRRKAS